MKAPKILICEEEMIEQVRSVVSDKFVGQDIIVVTPNEAKERFNAGAHLVPKVINIEGKPYAQVQQPKPFGGKLPAVLMGMMMMSGMAGIYDSGTPKTNPIAGVDIVEEFALIQQKKSRLSKRERDMVVQVFNQNFILLETP